MRARRRCALPGYDYRSRSRRSRKIDVTTTAQEIDNPATSTAGGDNAKKPLRKIRVFQQGSSGLTDDHCSISKLTVSLEETGNWIVSFDAEQNPQLVTPVSDRPAFERFQRNWFYVELRGLGLARGAYDPNAAVLAAPQFFRIKLPVFRVEKGQTRSLRFQSQIKKPNANVKRYFSQIDRVEIHFHYE